MQDETVAETNAGRDRVARDILFTFEEEAVLGEGVVGAGVAVDGADHGDVVGQERPGLGAADERQRNRRHQQRHQRRHGNRKNSGARHCGHYEIGLARQQ